MATPTLRAIRRRFMDAHITFLMEPNLRGLVDGGDWMDECVEWPARGERWPLRKQYRDLAWDLRRRRFDWAVLLPNSFRAALLAWVIRAKRRIGYDRDGRGFLLTDRIPVRNWRSKSRVDPRAPVVVGDRLPVKLGPYSPYPLVEYYADLAEAIGCERPGDRLALFTTPHADEIVEARLESLGIAGRRPLAVISPGAKFGAAKCWPADRFAAVADRLIESEDAAVIVTCGPGEEPIACAIGAAMKHTGFVFDSPPLTLGELKSLIRRCDLLICNDAGPRHFAKAFEVPVVTVFGPTHPEWTSTSYAMERIVRIDVECGPCQQRTCPLGHHRCMMGVTVDDVFLAASDLLRTHASTHARSG
jgi:heptosyltransferase-2